MTRLGTGHNPDRDSARSAGLKPYYSDEHVELFHGDCREVLPALGMTFDAVVADPPYKATPLAWDRWPDGWLAAVASGTDSLWCFGNLRMFGTRWAEFAAAGWKLSHDAVGEFEIDTTVWEKHNGSGFATDRLRGVHELVTHWYRGRWADVHHVVPKVPSDGSRHARIGDVARKGPMPLKHTSRIGASDYADDGTRLMRSVIHCRSTHHSAIHPTQKPTDLLVPLIEYAVPPGGVVLDPTAGSCSTGVAAKLVGRRAVLIEADEAMCEKAATRLAAHQADLFGAIGGEVA